MSLARRNGAQARQLGVGGRYAPGLNLHRSVMGGRNFEYYSEDPVLSGIMSASTIRGFLRRRHLCLRQAFHRL